MIGLALGIICFVISIFFSVYAVYDLLKTGRKAENYPERSKLKQKPNYAIWIYVIVSLCQIIIMAIRIFNVDETGNDPEAEKIKWALWGSAFVLLLAVEILALLRGYVYITPEGVLRGGGRYGFSPAEEWEYKLEDDKLLLYFRKSNSPMKFKIIEGREKLEEILSESYMKKISI